jgi:hypothetical protein
MRRFGPLVVFLALVGWTALHFGPTVLLYVQQWRALSCTPPADLVVYREDEDLRNQTLASERNSRSFNVSIGAPPRWWDFTRNAGVRWEPVFVGEMDAGRGKRIVFACITGIYSCSMADPVGTMRCCLGVRVFQPGTIFKPPASCGSATATAILFPGASPLRVFAGQVSTSDPARVTIDCDTGGPNGVRESLDFTLQGDDTVQITPRTGVAKTGAAQAHW